MPSAFSKQVRFSYIVSPTIHTYRDRENRIYEGGAGGGGMVVNVSIVI